MILAHQKQARARRLAFELEIICTVGASINDLGTPETGSGSAVGMASKLDTIYIQWTDGNVIGETGICIESAERNASIQYQYTRS